MIIFLSKYIVTGKLCFLLNTSAVMASTSRGNKTSQILLSWPPQDKAPLHAVVVSLCLCGSLASTRPVGKLHPNTHTHTHTHTHTALYLPSETHKNTHRNRHQPTHTNARWVPRHIYHDLVSLGPHGYTVWCLFTTHKHQALASRGTVTNSHTTIHQLLPELVGLMISRL